MNDMISYEWSLEIRGFSIFPLKPIKKHEKNFHTACFRAA
jgi:hypothetical protein